MMPEEPSTFRGQTLLQLSSSLKQLRSALDEKPKLERFRQLSLLQVLGQTEG